MAALQGLPLEFLHRELGARLAPFAGYNMPLRYGDGSVAEHLHCRKQAALFDVSHMGQARLIGADVGAALESVVPSALQTLPVGRQRYTLLLNDDGGIVDDLIVANTGQGADGRHWWHVVVNAARKDVDFAYLRDRIGDRVDIQPLDGHCLLALQGPAAATTMATLCAASTSLLFMDARPMEVAGTPCWVARSGYTGEDGFELSVPADGAEHVARRLLAAPEVQPAGLSARDTLRLEASLPLYGSDIDDKVTPVESGLSFTIGKSRRSGGDFPGAKKILDQLAGAPLSRCRVGLLLEGRAPARAQAAIKTPDGQVVGKVTSGSFAPSLGKAIAMGYVDPACAVVGTPLNLMVRDKALGARVVKMPFVRHRLAPRVRQHV